jgi:hypothetical protein
LKQATQQRILNEVNQELADLSEWLRGLGVSEAEAVSLHDAAMRENGMLAGVVLNLARNVIAVDGAKNLGTVHAGLALAWVRSGEFATWLLSQPEPTPKKLDQALSIVRNALANLREHLLNSGKRGPRHRRGGRPEEIAEPEERAKIREAIESLHKSRVRYEDAYQRLADKFGVSSSTIKRIRFEKTDQNPPGS